MYLVITEKLVTETLLKKCHFVRYTIYVSSSNPKKNSPTYSYDKATCRQKKYQSPSVPLQSFFLCPGSWSAHFGTPVSYLLFLLLGTRKNSSSHALGHWGMNYAFLNGFPGLGLSVLAQPASGTFLTGTVPRESSGI